MEAATREVVPTIIWDSSYVGISLVVYKTSPEACLLVWGRKKEP